MTFLSNSKEKLLKITAVFPIKNQIELFCMETQEVFYFRFFAHQSVQSQLKVGDFFLVRGHKFQVLKKNRNKVHGLSGSLDTSRQLVLFSMTQESRQ